MTLLDHYELLKNNEILESRSLTSMLLSSLLKNLFKINGLDDTKEDVFKDIN